MSSIKGKPLTKDEVIFLVGLIEETPAITSKATNASNNLLKDEAWSKLTEKFNASVSSTPRTPEQLRLKWENLKKTARKRSTKIRNHFKISGGKPDVIPPHDALDRVASILSATGVGNEIIVTTPKPKKFFFNTPSGNVNEKLKRKLVEEDIKARTAKNKALTEYYILKKRKLELEIEKLEFEKLNK